MAVLDHLSSSQKIASYSLSKYIFREPRIGLCFIDLGPPSRSTGWYLLTGISCMHTSSRRDRSNDPLFFDFFGTIQPKGSKYRYSRLGYRVSFRRKYHSNAQTLWVQLFVSGNRFSGLSSTLFRRRGWLRDVAGKI